jgi:hypothetical protein
MTPSRWFILTRRGHSAPLARRRQLQRSSVRAGMESDPLVLEELSTPLEGLERHLSSRMLPSNEPDE